MSLTSDPVFQLYVGCTLILALNLLVLANNTALSRSKAGQVVNPEDKKLNATAEVVFDEGNERTARYRRAHRNALENIPLFLITGLLLPMIGTPVMAAAILYGVFVLARVLHSICYVRQIQPLRSICFGLGALAQVAVLGFIAWGTFFGA